MAFPSPSAKTRMDHHDAADAPYELLIGTGTFDEFLERIARLAVHEFGAETSCEITARTDQRNGCGATRGAFAGRFDKVQYAPRFGPSLHALNTGEVVQVDDFSGDNRWGSDSTDAYAHGLRSSLSVPIGPPGQVVGALSLYSLDRHHFAAEHRRRAARFAHRAAGAVAVAARISAQTRLAEHLQLALESRAVIDQAIGVVMAQRRCKPHEAFGVLRAASQRRNVKLRTIAADVVDSLRPPASS